jgi:tetratricopeptide (TPR) repeat protein
MGAPRAIALCQCFNGALEFQAGRWSEAEPALRESIKLYHELGAAAGEALALQRLGTLLTARGRLDEALPITISRLAWQSAIVTVIVRLATRCSTQPRSACTLHEARFP